MPIEFSGKNETIPPAVLRHDPNTPALRKGRQLRRGRQLIARYRCLRCHEPAGRYRLTDAAMPELSADAPSFVGIGSRLQDEWMAQWIINPRALRPTSTMPSLLNHKSVAAAIQAEDRRAWDIAAFLATLKERTSGNGASAFGSNLLGAMCGGGLEYTSMIFGIGAMGLLAAGLYSLAYLLYREHRKLELA